MRGISQRFNLPSPLISFTCLLPPLCFKQISTSLLPYEWKSSTSLKVFSSFPPPLGHFPNLQPSLKWHLSKKCTTVLQYFNILHPIPLCFISLLVVCIWRHKKHDYANYDQFPQNFDMACKTIQPVSVSNLNLFGLIKTELWVKEVCYVIWENGLVGILLPTIMAATI